MRKIRKEFLSKTHQTLSKSVNPEAYKSKLKKNKEYIMIKNIFKDNKMTIMQNLKDYLTKDIKNDKDRKEYKLTEEKALSIFYQDYKQNKENMYGEGVKKINKQEALLAAKYTINSAAYKDAKTRQFENLSISIKKDKKWEIFRSMNNHQKINPNLLVEVKSEADGVQQAFKYGDKILIEQYYKPNGEIFYKFIKYNNDGSIIQINEQKFDKDGKPI